MNATLRPLATLCIAAAAVAVGTAALAQSAGGAMSLGIDRSQRVQLRGAVTSVIVSNPQIADVTVVDAHTLVVTGKGYGSTEIMAVDAIGRSLFQNQIVVSRGDAGTMRVWRGAQATEMACGQTCSPSLREYANAGPSSAAAPTPAP